MNILDMEMHDRLDLLAPLAPILQELAGIGRRLEKLGVSLENIRHHGLAPAPSPRWNTPTPGTVTQPPPHLPPATVHATITQLAGAHTPEPPGPWALTAQQRQHILDELRRADATAWLPNGGYRRHGRAARSRRRTR
ncbi:hypothetical protein DUY81_08460 [Acidipropionibacterium acidipropionici]|uniref:Uncharacterized protein n=1 Tax=Acidipropionibacterium acidipropionici TaxID=1748 RepID=A0AAC8YDH4_9ACTN|nr:hypothetical protein [Acidipropionibacterium acidipropionici]AMS04657.1 hypothetical protein AXH35_03325 [Acidipropionibacterium acidipropionici]AOZ46146.1 hypothetical protein A8L58_04790 [Acidipropionibacterium acidipropionici]AZP37825.1 hypothetical protein DUY81_08460 [Acidipropionibacterium acidipropionici]